MLDGDGLAQVDELPQAPSRAGRRATPLRTPHTRCARHSPRFTVALNFSSRGWMDPYASGRRQLMPIVKRVSRAKPWWVITISAPGEYPTIVSKEVFSAAVARGACRPAYFIPLGHGSRTVG